MLNIKRFIEKVTNSDSKSSNTLVLPISEARLLRDEIAKLIADNYELLSKQKGATDDNIQVEITGGTW
jgi:hypothetical protein